MVSVRWFRINRLPDLTLNKYESIADAGVDGLLKRHSSFLRQWHGICEESGASLHLLYIFDPNRRPGNRLGIWLGLRAEEGMFSFLVPLLNASPLGEFFEFEDSAIDDVVFSHGATLTKRERVAPIFNPLSATNVFVHFVPTLETNPDSRLYDLFKAMKAVADGQCSREPVGFRADLYPAQDVSKVRDKLNPVLSTLRAEHSIKLRGGMEDIKANDMARKVVDLIDAWIDSVETTPCFSSNIYGFASTPLFAKFILNAAASEAVERGDVTLTPIRRDSDGLLRPTSRLGDLPMLHCQYPDNALLASWPTLFLMEEIEPFFRLPALHDGEEIETPKETSQEQYDGGILLGHTKYGHEVMLPVDKLSRHALLCGMPGAGKTNTMLHLVTELHARGIPFLVLEPAKKEYRSLLLMDGMDDVFCFSPHLRSLFPLRINPMEFPKGVRLSSHIEALIQVFEGSFFLQDSTKKLLGDAIQSSYTRLGWDIEEVNGEVEGRTFPTISDVQGLLSEAIDATDYDREMKGNMRSFLEVRLGSLLERDTGEVLNSRVSTLAPEEWIETSAIVELEVLGEQAKNFLVLLLCHYILETLRVDPKGGTNGSGGLMPIRHALFIEEAHNIIAPSSVQTSSENVDPKVSATAYIVKMLAEVRALREALFISDQLPTALAVEVTKNTGIKVVHRLSASDDRQQVGTAITASGLQLEQMATLNRGSAFLFHEDTQRPFLVDVEMWDKPQKPFDESDDAALFDFRKDTPATRRAIMSALDAFYAGCIEPCSASLEYVNLVLDRLIVLRSMKGILLSRIDTTEEALKRAMKRIDAYRNNWFCVAGSHTEIGMMIDKMMLYATEMQKEIALLRERIAYSQMHTE